MHEIEQESFYSIQRMTEFLHLSFDVQYVNSITILNFI